MLIKRSLPLPPQALLEPILRREVFDDVLRGEQLLDCAMQQSEELLQATEQQCQQYLQSAQAQFWEAANRQLQGFADENAALQCQMLASIDRVLGLALTRLLDETDLTQRIGALLRNLADSQIACASATLSCHPQQAQAVQAWLEDSKLAALWTVQQDTQVPLQALHLSHAQGALEIDWEALCHGLLGQYSPQVVAETVRLDGSASDNGASQRHFHHQED